MEMPSKPEKLVCPVNADKLDLLTGAAVTLGSQAPRMTPLWY